MRHRWSRVFCKLYRLREAAPRRLSRPDTLMAKAAPFRSEAQIAHGSLMNRLAIPSPSLKPLRKFLMPLANAFSSIRPLVSVGLALASAAVLFVASAPEPAVAAHHKDSASALYKKAEVAEAKEDYDTAVDDFKKAYEEKPDDLRYRTAYYRLRQTAGSFHVTRGHKMLAQGDETNALTEFMRASQIDPGNEAAVQQIEFIRSHQNPQAPHAETSLSTPSAGSIDDMSSPAELKPGSTELFTLHMAEDTKVIYQAIGKQAGINVLFDPDYNSKRIQVDLKDVPLLDALRIVGTLSTTFWRPITENTIFVAQNSRAKRTELDEQAVQTFYLSNAWQQNDLNDVQTALRNVLPNAHAYGVPSQNAIVMRGTPDELMLARKVIGDLDKARPEVVVDIAVMEVNRDKLRNIGLSWPGSISFALQPPTSQSTTTTTTDGTTSSTGTLTLDNLANLNASNFAVTVSAATANLLLSDSDTKILQNPRIRATDQQKATMKIGSRIPVATGSYQTGAATAITSSLVNTQFQYIDVGVQIEMTPTVHFDHDVTLKLSIEVSSESGTSTISGVTEPIIAQNKTDGVVRLREGEATILSGILNKQDIVSLSGIPGLAELPILKYLFGSKSHEVIDDEIVFVLIPHVVREQNITPLNVRAIDTGSGQAIELRHVSLLNGQPVSLVPAVATGNAQVRPMLRGTGNVGPVTGQTAAAAAGAAMAQLRQGVTSDLAVPPAAPPITAAPPSTASAPVSLTLTPGTLNAAVGATFPVSVVLNGGTDIASVPLQIQYDATKLSLVNVASGGLLTRDGQAADPIHRDDGPGTLTVIASRPPGVAGVTGSGTVYTLMFQAKQAGESDIVISRPGALDSQQHPIPATAQNAHVIVQ
jgi:general secretion pathway protein D